MKSWHAEQLLNRHSHSVVINGQYVGYVSSQTVLYMTPEVLRGRKSCLYNLVRAPATVKAREKFVRRVAQKAGRTIMVVRIKE